MEVGWWVNPETPNSKNKEENMDPSEDVGEPISAWSSTGQANVQSIQYKPVKRMAAFPSTETWEKVVLSEGKVCKVMNTTFNISLQQIQGSTFSF